MKVLTVIFFGLLALSASAISCGKDGFECDGDDGVIITDEDTFPYNSLPEDFPILPEAMVDFDNDTFIVKDMMLEQEEEAGLLQSSAGAIEFSISVAEITGWIAKGGNNPLEAGLIRKILAFLNSAGISIQGGSLVYQFANGPDTELKGGCSSVHLTKGWNAHASLKPGFKVSLSFGVNDASLVVSSAVRSECDFGMSGHIQAKFGKKIFGKCLRVIRKTESVKIGAYMVMNIVSRLELKPTLNIDAQLNAVIGLVPKYQLRGDLLVFNPTGKVSIKIFGIHIGFIEKAISNAIKNGMKKAFNQKTVDAQFKAITDAVQKNLNSALANAKWKIPLMPTDLVPKMKNAVANIHAKQAANM